LLKLCYRLASNNENTTQDHNNKAAMPSGNGNRAKMKRERNAKKEAALGTAAAGAGQPVVTMHDLLIVFSSQ
jgi:hypothetical protein